MSKHVIDRLLPGAKKRVLDVPAVTTLVNVGTVSQSTRYLSICPPPSDRGYCQITFNLMLDIANSVTLKGPCGRDFGER